MKNGADDNGMVFTTASLYRTRSELPLGWVLSEQVQIQIQQQLTGCARNANDCGFNAIRKVENELRGATP
jgi:hypothetical protein